jgi:phosphopantothenoylcysteine decarboxylase/phosphopantothenate--cysteine ligase
MNGRELVVGITGGIASYKTAALVSQLVQAGAGVSVVMTAAAGEFIGPATLEALTGRPVYRDLFAVPEFPLGAHIGLAQRASVLCVAPATANFLAKTALGLADDLLSTLVLAFAGPVLLAPAMNSTMWSKPAVERNVAQLRLDGYRFIDPEDGWLSCRQHGAGRMASPETIFAALQKVMNEP